MGGAFIAADSAYEQTHVCSMFAALNQEPSCWSGGRQMFDGVSEGKEDAAVEP